MMKKKLTSLLLVLAMVLTLLSVSAAATGAASISLSPSATTVAPGATFTVDLDITAGAGFGALTGRVAVFYDSSKLEYVSAAEGDMLTSPTWSCIPRDESGTAPMRIASIGYNTASTTDVTTSGTWGTITFKAKTGVTVGDTTDITVVPSSAAAGWLTGIAGYTGGAIATTLTLPATPTTITFGTGGGSTPSGPSATVAMSNASTTTNLFAPGTNFTVPIVVTPGSTTSVGAQSYSITWDPSKLTYNGFTGNTTDFPTGWIFADTQGPAPVNRVLIEMSPLGTSATTAGTAFTLGTMSFTVAAGATGTTQISYHNDYPNEAFIPTSAGGSAITLTKISTDVYMGTATPPTPPATGSVNLSDFTGTDPLAGWTKKVVGDSAPGAQTFTFTFAKDAAMTQANADNATLAGLEGKTVAAWTTDYLPDVTGVPATGYTVTTPAAGGAGTYNIVTTGADIAFDHVGTFYYKVTESGPAAVPGSKWVYDQTDYYLEIMVGNKADGTGLEIAAVNVWKDANHNGTLKNPLNPDDAGDGKLGATPLSFTNKYDTVETTQFTMTKKVTGNMANVNQTFHFDLEIRDTATGAAVTDCDSLTANVTHADGSTVAGSPYTITAGAISNILMGNGDSLVIEGLPLDKYVYAHETDGGEYVTTISTKSGDAGALIPVASTTDDASVKLASGNNIISFTNTLEFTPPTGLDLTFAPFVMLGLVACGGLVMIVRKKITVD